MYCGCRGCTSQGREPVGQLVPFEKHDCQTHHPASDVIGFLVKGRCVRSRRLFWRLRRSIFNLLVTGLFVANLLTTAEFRNSSQDLTVQAAAGKNHRFFGKRPINDRMNSGSRPLREKPRVAGWIAPNYGAADLTLAPGPGCKFGCAKMSMNISILVRDLRLRLIVG